MFTFMVETYRFWTAVFQKQVCWSLLTCVKFFSPSLCCCCCISLKFWKDNHTGFSVNLKKREEKKNFQSGILLNSVYMVPYLLQRWIWVEIRIQQPTFHTQISCSLLKKNKSELYKYMHLPEEKVIHPQVGKDTQYTCSSAGDLN